MRNYRAKLEICKEGALYFVDLSKLFMVYLRHKLVQNKKTGS